MIRLNHKHPSISCHVHGEPRNRSAGCERTEVKLMIIAEKAADSCSSISDRSVFKLAISEDI